jgi:hypothetical protein
MSDHEFRRDNEDFGVAGIPDRRQFRNPGKPV